QTGRGRRRVLRLRVPARLARDDVVESVPPSAALNRPTLSFSPFLTTTAPGPGSDNILNVGENVTNEVGDLRNVVSNPLDRHVDHILSAGPDKLTEASRTDTLRDFVLNLLERPSKPIKTETAAGAVTRRATGTNLRTTRRVEVSVVIVSRCPPDDTNLREFLTEHRNPFIEERLLRRILTTRTIVSVESSPRIMQRIPGVSANPLTPRLELGNTGALLLPPFSSIRQRATLSQTRCPPLGSCTAH